MIDKKRDILYSVSTNHSYGSPDVIAIDLSEFRKNMYKKGATCRDMLVYAPGYEEFHAFAEHWQDIKIKIAKYAANFKAKAIAPVRLWDRFDDDGIANAAVKGLRFINNETVEGICGDTENYRFVIENGKLITLEKATDELANAILKPAPSPRDGMPCYPGRQWRNDVTCECEWVNSSTLVGTADGFLAKIGADGSVYSIGPAICQGPVRDLCADPIRGIAYGVGGDVEDVGNVFRFSESDGLTYLGYMCCDVATDDVGVCANFVLSSCAISPDGKTLAVGACDRLSCVYICTLQ